MGEVARLEDGLPPIGESPPPPLKPDVVDVDVIDPVVEARDLLLLGLLTPAAE